MDKLAMEEAGFRNCVSVPNGAPPSVSNKDLPSEEEYTITGELLSMVVRRLGFSQWKYYVMNTKTGGAYVSHFCVFIGYDGSKCVEQGVHDKEDDLKGLVDEEKPSLKILQSLSSMKHARRRPWRDCLPPPSHHPWPIGAPARPVEGHRAKMKPFEVKSTLIGVESSLARSVSKQISHIHSPRQRLTIGSAFPTRSGRVSDEIGARFRQASEKEAPIRGSQGDSPPLCKIPATKDTNYQYLWSCKEYLEKTSRIILATDGDPPGQALAEELARRLGRERCWRVKWPRKNDVDHFKDANEVQICLEENEVPDWHEFLTLIFGSLSKAFISLGYKAYSAIAVQ
ncbi:toprim domain-containing protein [Actinidia rufa]|uniref:Toprim domain-containing protein n=1 Tax=Actinidia rufa TaxID=165716 RepID=A0A7J0DSD6_9ERIC|nr:toprim domain-containing protein [Actinidia rufa]